MTEQKVTKPRGEKLPIKIREKVVFEFARTESMERVVLALSMAGYYVKVTSGQVGYVVYIYTDREDL